MKKLYTLLVSLLVASSVFVQGAEKDDSTSRYAPVSRHIEGWTVSVDPQMLDGENAEEGERALEMLRNHLQRIAILVPGDRLEKLRKVGIWIERDHPTELCPLQYHPGVEWLVERGYDPRLAKKVHIAQASFLLDRQQLIKHPAFILHELAHGYHDQVPGFDEPRIVDAYNKAMKSGIYEDVLLFTGERTRSYATTNPMEYFAEMTEAYFYKNDIYPFVRAELKEYDSEMHDLLVDIWGKL